MIVGCPSSVVNRRQILLQSTPPPKLRAAFFLPNLAEMILIWSSLIIVQMVSVHCIFRAYRLKKSFEMKTLKFF